MVWVLGASKICLLKNAIFKTCCNLQVMQAKAIKGFTSIFLLLLLIIMGCGPRLPKKALERTKQVKISYGKTDSELNIALTNLLKCPTRIIINSSKDLPWKIIQLKPQQDTVLNITWREAIPEISFGAEYGDPSIPVKDVPIEFPVSRKRDIRILQGYYGSLSHDHDMSKFALDFSLPVGDTLYAATSGYVVEVVEGYKYGANEESWIEFGNKILFYNPASNRFFLYSHLVQKGSFVSPGEYIEAGQPIGLSGNTGYSSKPHLHFAVLIADKLPGGLTSVPFDFVGGYKGEQFRTNSVLPKQ